jgi:3-methyladenine DNA glycosylase Mpg
MSHKWLMSQVGWRQEDQKLSRCPSKMCRELGIKCKSDGREEGLNKKMKEQEDLCSYK